MKLKKQIMCKSVCFTFLVFVLLSFSGHVFAQRAFLIYNIEGEQVDFDQVIQETEGKSHIFFGELHNNPIGHWLQLELTKALFQSHGDRLVIGVEMFEADNQLLIDEYFSDKISQKNFEDEVRLWKNYKTDYKPILEFAKKNKLKFIATNIPRRYANIVYHNGIGVLNELSEQAKSYIAPLPIEIDTTQKSYQEISKMVEGHKGKNMMEAQAVKDATMAHFTLENSGRKTVFLHLNGSYHSDRKEGIVNFLSRDISLKKILTITTVSQDQIDELDERNRQLADFIIVVDSDMTTTH